MSVPRFCVGTDSAAHNDDVRHDCSHSAVVECFTINGKWEPLCERHGAPYAGSDRSRPIGVVQASKADAPRPRTLRPPSD